MTGVRDDERMAAAVKAEDGFFATFAVSSYSPHIVRWAADRRITPNQVTAASVLLAVAAAAAFATGQRAGLVAGAVLVQLTFTADCVDGQLARYTATSSPVGAWLDAVSDRIKEFLLYAGLAVGGAQTGDRGIWLLAACALALQALRHQADFAYGAQHTGGVGGATTDAPAPGVGGAGVRTADALEGSWLRWVKRIIVLPIGERFALISLTAAFAGPRTTFTALLVWGGVAAVYMVSGRVLRSLAHAPGTAGRDTGPGSALLDSHRDDGPVALALRRLAPAGTPAAWTALAAAAVLATALLIDGADTGGASVAGVGIFVALGAATGATPAGGRMRWIVPPLLHTGEYVAVIVLAGRAGALPAVFALLAVVAYHHYELIYLRGTAPVPRPIDLAAGGWDGRMLLLTLASVAGVRTGVAVALAVWGVLLFGVAGARRVRALAADGVREGRAR